MRGLYTLLAFAAVFGLSAASAERAAVVVTPGGEQTYRIAVQQFRDANPKLAAEFRAALTAALEYSNVFRQIPDDAFLGPVTTAEGRADAPLDCPNWSQIGADALVEGEIERDPAGFSIAFRVWDASRCRRLLRRRYQQSGRDLERAARRLADDVVEAFIGLRGVSSTEIAFVSDRGGNKEIYVMNADGSNARAATANRSINNFPSWSPDGEGIIYTSYRQQNRPLIFLSSRGKARPGRLLSRLGVERSLYRAVFSPDPNRMALVMSTGEAADLFTVAPDGGRLKRLTRSRAIDISPSFSPDGERLSFVSDRTGSPQIYLMNADGTNIRRLTFDGSYNTNPKWSPDGLWIAYETRVGGQFDIWLIDPDGTVNVPLVTNPRSDEAPSWSPNSRKLIFSSTRRGRADLYVIDRDGSSLRRLTSSAGNNTSPDWGPFPR